MKLKNDEVFDYVIAGGGSAGCVIASRLAENKKNKVCLIEAGGKGKDLFIKMPAGNGFVFGNPKLDWGYTSVSQKNLNNRSIYFPRGKSLGGSSIVNGMIYMRGVSRDYDIWRQMGLNGWGYADLLPYFKRSQGSLNRKGVYHGQGGPLKTDISRNYGKLEDAFIKAAIREGHRKLDDFNGGNRSGVGRVDSTVSKGIRQTSAIAYLKTNPSNLCILTNKHVNRILFDKKRAVAVETSSGLVVRASKEIIVSQGAIGSPQLLMLSGIGPAQHLSENGIQPIVDLPGVGKNLADHVDVSIQYGSRYLNLSHARHQRLDKAALLLLQWLFKGSGPGGGSLFSVNLFHSIREPENPEFQVYMTPMIIEENFENGRSEKVPWFQSFGRKILVRGRKMAKPGIQIDINLERPRSTGTISLDGPNPSSYPIIDPNYFSDDRDLEDMIKGVKDIREIMMNEEISKFTVGEIGFWKDANDRDEIIRAIRETAYTGHHLCSSAKMGAENDPLAVLDKELKVKGVAGLRVCDASSMPTQITGNLYATVVAFAEKASDLILGRDSLRSENPMEIH